MVVAVYQADGCEGSFSVTDLFNEMERFVGHETTRPLSNDACSYWYVEAIFDTQLGYPITMETHAIRNLSKRKQYILLNHTFACLATSPILPTFTIESLTPLP